MSVSQALVYTPSLQVNIKVKCVIYIFPMHKIKKAKTYFLKNKK